MGGAVAVITEDRLLSIVAVAGVVRLKSHLLWLASRDRGKVTPDFGSSLREIGKVEGRAAWRAMVRERLAGRLGWAA